MSHFSSHRRAAFLTAPLTPLVALTLALVATPARAGDPPAPPRGGAAKEPADPLRVYVPYDPAKGDPARSGEAGSGKVFLPREVYEELLRRAFPDEAPLAVAPLPAPHVITGVDYTGALREDADTRAELTLTSAIALEVLAEGWQRVPLGLAGAGLRATRVTGGHPDAKVRVAPAGGFELVARGPGVYRVELDLIVPERNTQGGRGHSFATVPCLAARMALSTDVGEKRVLVEGARAQLEQDVQGTPTVLASLGDAPRVTLLRRSREVLSAGASEASASTDALVWVRRGRIAVVSETTFTISGAGREGFRFELPEGLEVTSVELPGSENLRGWRVEGRQLELTLRRPTGRTARVRVVGELRLAPDATRFDAPLLTAQGVSYEAGAIGLATDEGLKVRAATIERLRQTNAGRLASLPRATGAEVRVELAYEFARRPCRLELERVEEAVDAKADAVVRALVLPDRYELRAEVRYDVRQGKLYELSILTPPGFELVGAPRGLDVREVGSHPASDDQGVVHTFGLASGLSGAATLELTFAQPLALSSLLAGDDPDASARLPFPDLRPLGVSRETTRIALGAGQGLELRVPADPVGLEARDAASLVRNVAEPSGAGEAGDVRWGLGFLRESGRRAGLAQATVEVRQPKPYVAGSWVLHARVERDVVRYALRALYEVENAGVRRFEVLLPAEVTERITVEAQNQREVNIVPAGDGQARLIVDLQSPAEVFYDLAVTWEEVLQGEAPFTLPRVDVTGVDRRVKGFVLVEKAPEVGDELVEEVREGAVAEARAVDAPALPPGKVPQDFARVYQVAPPGAAAAGSAAGPGRDGASWTVRCLLKRRTVKLPPPAAVPYAEVESVFTREGRVRHRVRYRVRNLRLQFLALELPPQAEVWSVFVAGQPKRLHHQGQTTLIPLPKRSDADLSFDVELIYATPLEGAFGFGEVRAVAPTLKTPEVTVDKTFWTVYLPPDYDYRGFEGPGLEATSRAGVEVVALEAEIRELGQLDEVARSGGGNKASVAYANFSAQRQRVEAQLASCLEVLGASSGGTSTGEAGRSWQDLLSKNQGLYQQLERQADERQRELLRKRAKLSEQRAQTTQTYEGNSFERAESGWSFNQTQFKKGNKVQWAGVEDETRQQSAEREESQDYTLSVPEGQSLNLENAELFEGQGGPQQQQRGGQRRMLQNQNYDHVQQQSQREAGRREAQNAQDAFGRALPRMDPAGLRADGDAADAQGEGQGLLSIRIDFATPGRALQFVTDTSGAPALRFKSYPTETADVVRRAAQGLALLLLLAAVVRLGLHRPIPGRGAAQTLCLLVAGALAAGVFAHVLPGALAFLLSLWAVRHGPLFGADPVSASAGAGVTS